MSQFRPPGRRVTRQLLTTGALAAGLTLLPVAAQAHVRVFADNHTSGAYSALTLRVPNESDQASTVKVAVALPQDTPFLYVSTKPVNGWKSTVSEATLPTPIDASGTTITKAVRTVTWTADDESAIKPGEYQEFALSVGPLPAAGTVLLPATQTYSDGKVVQWDQPETPGGAEPESPAPALVVTAAAAESGTPAPTAAPSTAPAAVPSSGSDGVARGLAGGALAVAVAALVAALVGRRRARVSA